MSQFNGDLEYVRDSLVDIENQRIPQIGEFVDNERVGTAMLVLGELRVLVGELKVEVMEFLDKKGGK